MVFNSYIFIIVFVPLFLALFYALGHFFKDNRALFIVIIAASLVFYANGKLLPGLFLICEVLVNYLFSIAIRKTGSRWCLTFAIVLNLGILCFTKYLDMGISLANILLKTDMSVKNYPVPLGISFITFQQIAFLVYSYRNREKKADFLQYSVFTTNFPHIAQGPILEPAEYLEGRFEAKIGKVNWDNISSGLLLFTIGLSKKVLLADVYALMVNAAYANLEKLNFVSALFVSFAYTLQIYFDFSGYCDMAMGIGRMINIDLPINFNSPYKAKTIDEFWDRWHITLTRFFTKYVYIPLGGNRKGSIRTLINIMIIFLVSGLWHGANLTFVLWGALHGLMMVFSRIFKNAVNKTPKLISQTLTFLFVNFAWVLFRAGSFTNLRGMLRGFKTWGLKLVPEITESFTKVGVLDLGEFSNAWTAFAFLIVGLVIVFGFKNSVELVEENKWSPASAVVAVALLLICVLSFTGTTTYVYMMF